MKQEERIFNGFEFDLLLSAVSVFSVFHCQ